MEIFPKQLENSTIQDGITFKRYNVSARLSLFSAPHIILKFEWDISQRK